jgi:hypothetical protein
VKVLGIALLLVVAAVAGWVVFALRLAGGQTPQQ